MKATVFKSALLFAALCVTLEAQDNSLHIGVTHTLEAHAVGVPPFSFNSHHCDDDGNVFFNLTKSNYSQQIILRLSKDAKVATPILLPTELSKSGDWLVSVSDSGELYVLHTSATEHTLIHYSQVGEEISRRLVHVPAGFQTSSFAVLNDMAAMLFGVVLSNEVPAPKSAKPIAVWLDASGNIVKMKQEGSIISPLAPATGVVTTLKGDKYVEVVDAEVRILDEAGQLLRATTIPKPTPDSFPSSSRVVGWELALTYSHLVEEAGQTTTAAPYVGPLEQSWALVSLTSPLSVIGSFRQPNTFTGTALCYLGGLRFSYLTVINGTHFVIEAGQ